jgi:hypothetical protein
LPGKNYVTRNNGINVGSGVFSAVLADSCHAKIEKLLLELFSAVYVQKLYNKERSAVSLYTRGSNLAAVKHTTVQVTRLPL